jgi:hypothetical protein
MTAYKSGVRGFLRGATSAHDLVTLEPGINFNSHGADQLFLNRVLWPQCLKQTLVHQPGEVSRYPAAGTSRQVAPKVHVLDTVVNHIGAGFDRERCQRALAQILGGIPNLERIEACERT